MLDDDIISEEVVEEEEEEEEEEDRSKRTQDRQCLELWRLGFFIRQFSTTLVLYFNS